MIRLQPSVELIRLEENHDFGTFGILRIDKQVFCCTLEPPDILNAQNISCIPAQQYLCVRYESPSFGETFCITRVPFRKHVLFHPGNKKKDTAGCPLLGRKWGVLKKDRGILNSGETFKEFMDILKDHMGFILTVKECY